MTEKYTLKLCILLKKKMFFDLHLLSASSPVLLSVLITPSRRRLHMKAASADRNKVAGWVSGDGRSGPVCLFAVPIIKVLPGLLLLHHHVWSPPRVLEVPLERVGQDLCHLCRSGERRLSYMAVSSEEANV